MSRDTRNAYLRNGVVGRVDRLQTFFSRNTDSDIRSLDHTDIVGAVSDSKTHHSKVVLDQANNLGFLQGGNTAANDCVALGGEMQKQLFGRSICESL